MPFSQFPPVGDILDNRSTVSQETDIDTVHLPYSDVTIVHTLMCAPTCV